MEEMTISVKDLLLRVLLKWRMILVWMLIGAVILDGVGYMRSFQAARQAREALKTPEDDEEQSLLAISEAEQKLSAREVTEVKAAVGTYRSYQQEYLSTLNYNMNSIRMQLDPNSVPTMTVQYFINNHYQAVYPVIEAKDTTSDIISTFISKVTNTEVCEQIVEELKWDIDSAYVQELITAFQSADDILTISVMGQDQDDCEKMAAIIQKVVENETTGLKTLYGDFDMEVLHKQYYKGANASLLSTQQTQVTGLNNIKNAMNNITSAMTEEQKDYYFALLDKEKADNAVDEPEMEEEEASVLPQTPEVKLFSLKYVLLGAFVGVFLACCYIAFRYLITSVLRVKEDLEEVFGAPLLGSLTVSEVGHRFLGQIDRLMVSLFAGRRPKFSEEERVEMICAGIRIAAKKAGMQSVYLTSACHDEKSEQIRELLCDKLRGEVETISHGKSVVYDPESLERMVSADGVVLVEMIDASPYADIQKELELCKMYKIPVIGSVVLE